MNDMCGRFTLFVDPLFLQQRFGVDVQQLNIQPRYNIAPSQNILAVVNDRETNRAGLLRWGLVPVWAKDPKIGYKMINARGETVHEKPSYKRLLKRRRCLIPADGFYEWKKKNGRKQPFRITLKNGEPFAFAGLWDRWETEGNVIQSCTIITTTPNELMKDIHNRMPVILKPEHEEAWSDRDLDNVDYLRTLLNPFEAEEMAAYEVSEMVNSPKNDHEEVSKPL